MSLLQNRRVIVIGAGACGMVATISAARLGNSVLLLEKLPQVGAKLKATGGGRCNLTNTLNKDEFMQHFGKSGRFMSYALEALSSKELQKFFNQIGVETHAPDGFRVFPATHDASSVNSALIKEINRLDIEIKTSEKVVEILTKDGKVSGVATESLKYSADAVIIATGGNGYPTLGSEGDGYILAKKLGHKVSSIYPAMMPLFVKESWVANCRADTIAKAHIKIDIKKYKKLSATGDLIFTKKGIRGPVVLDFSREITPLFDKYNEIPITVNMVKGLNQEQIREHFKKELAKKAEITTLELVSTLLPKSVAQELCKLSGVEPDLTLKKNSGTARDKLIALIAATPLTVIGHDGFKMAMVTRGGISLKEIESKTMQSKLVSGLYFCGEVVDLDGPCGGYNLQWAFASGYLAGYIT